MLENAYSEACDLWSLGVIAYMLLFGRPPFWGSNNDQMRARIKGAQVGGWLPWRGCTCTYLSAL